ncbi:MAG: PIG-L deacetylase family protein [Planctomycetota bacterium]
MKKVIMFFGAHADDMEIRAGGTMRKFVDKGYEGVSVMLTNNICGAYVDDTTDQYFSTGPAETSEIRHREAREAAEVLGLKLIFMDFKENSYFNGSKRVFFGTDDYDVKNTPGREPLMVATYLEHCIQDVVKVLVEHEPEIVITHNIANTNPEHCAAAHLTHHAFQIARGRVELGELWFTCRVQSPGDIIRLSPDVLIDISDYHPTKWEALQRHRSQRIAWDRVRVTDEYWGKVAGVKYAEAFRTISRGMR